MVKVPMVLHFLVTVTVSLSLIKVKKKNWLECKPSTKPSVSFNCNYGVLLGIVVWSNWKTGMENKIDHDSGAFCIREVWEAHSSFKSPNVPSQ